MAIVIEKEQKPKQDLYRLSDRPAVSRVYIRHYGLVGSQYTPDGIYVNYDGVIGDRQPGSCHLVGDKELAELSKRLHWRVDPDSLGAHLVLQTNIRLGSLRPGSRFHFSSGPILEVVQPRLLMELEHYGAIYGIEPLYQPGRLGTEEASLTGVLAHVIKPGKIVSGVAAPIFAAGEDFFQSKSPFPQLDRV